MTSKNVRPAVKQFLEDNGYNGNQIKNARNYDEQGKIQDWANLSPEKQKQIQYFDFLDVLRYTVDFNDTLVLQDGERNIFGKELNEAQRTRLLTMYLQKTGQIQGGSNNKK